MLPDFPSLKNDLERLLQLAARAQASSESGTAVPLPRRDVREGNRHTLVRQDGETVEGGFHTVSVQDSIPAEEAETLTLEQTFERYVALMGEIGAQEQEGFVEIVHEEKPRHGAR